MKLLIVLLLVAGAAGFLIRRSYRLFTGKESSCHGCSCGGECGDNCSCKEADYKK